LSNSSLQAELSREYKISPVLIIKWKKYYRKGKLFKNASSQDIARLKLRIKEFERLLGKHTLET